ncbi:hypothetical protein EDC04DRAFT_2669630 [Pisolithus marmoratus]|nr:hypothetical protein EDC04DRAFT_2669630 [Pisolithus marmoratus]
MAESLLQGCGLRSQDPREPRADRCGPQCEAFYEPVRRNWCVPSVQDRTAGTLSRILSAVEEAVRLRERLKDTVKSIKVVTVGPPKAVETLRTALAMGADSAIHVEIPEGAPSPEPLAVAKTLRELAIDDDAGQTGQMLAGLMDWAQATFASKVDVDVSTKVASVTREIDGGLEQLKCRLPIVITTDLRYASLPNIMKAKKKPIEKFTPADLGVDLTPRLQTLKVTEPPKRVGGGKVANVDELLAKLKEAGITPKRA